MHLGPASLSKGPLAIQVLSDCASGTSLVTVLVAVYVIKGLLMGAGDAGMEDIYHWDADGPRIAFKGPVGTRRMHLLADAWHANHSTCQAPAEGCSTHAESCLVHALWLNPNYDALYVVNP